MKLKLDENLGRRWAHELRNAGHDVHTIWDEQLSGASDIEVLAAAVNESRALVTIDLDFARTRSAFLPPTHTGSSCYDFATGPDATSSIISSTVSSELSKVLIRPATSGSSIETAYASTRNRLTDRRDGRR